VAGCRKLTRDFVSGQRREFRDTARGKGRAAVGKAAAAIKRDGSRVGFLAVAGSVA